MEFFSWIIDGMIASWVAGFILKDGGFGFIGNMVVGGIAGLLSGWIATNILHINATMSGISLESILVAFFGAVLLLIRLRFLRSRHIGTINRKNIDTNALNWKGYKGRLSWK
jgi:uncharacterized membrane protein YeaQ/YmgE (transglycosylase-associated protein family)